MLECGCVIYRGDICFGHFRSIFPTTCALSFILFYLFIFFFYTHTQMHSLLFFFLHSLLCASTSFSRNTFYLRLPFSFFFFIIFFLFNFSYMFTQFPWRLLVKNERSVIIFNKCVHCLIFIIFSKWINRLGITCLFLIFYYYYYLFFEKTTYSGKIIPRILGKKEKNLLLFLSRKKQIIKQ